MLLTTPPSSTLTGYSSPSLPQLHNEMMIMTPAVSPVSNFQSSTKKKNITANADTILLNLPSLASTVPKKKRSSRMLKLARKACSSGLRRSAYFLRRVQKAAVQSHSSHSVKITYHSTSPDKIMTYMSNPMRIASSSLSSSHRTKGIRSPSMLHQHLDPSHTPSDDAGQKVVSPPWHASSNPLKIMMMSNSLLSLPQSPTPVKSPIYCFSPALSLSLSVTIAAQSKQSSVIDHHSCGSYSSTDDNSSTHSCTIEGATDSPTSSSGSIDDVYHISLQDDDDDEEEEEEEEGCDFSSSPTCTLQVTGENYQSYSLGSCHWSSNSPDNYSTRLMPTEDLYSKLLRELRLHFIAEQQQQQQSTSAVSMTLYENS